MALGSKFIHGYSEVKRCIAISIKSQTDDRPFHKERILTYLSFSEHIFPESVGLVGGSSRSQLFQIEVKMTSLAIAQVLRAAQGRVASRARSTNGHHLVESLSDVAKIALNQGN